LLRKNHVNREDFVKPTTDTCTARKCRCEKDKRDEEKILSLSSLLHRTRQGICGKDFGCGWKPRYDLEFELEQDLTGRRWQRKGVDGSFQIAGRIRLAHYHPF